LYNQDSFISTVDTSLKAKHLSSAFGHRSEKIGPRVNKKLVERSYP